MFNIASITEPSVSWQGESTMSALLGIPSISGGRAHFMSIRSRNSCSSIMPAQSKSTSSERGMISIFIIRGTGLPSSVRDSPQWSHVKTFR